MSTLLTESIRVAPLVRKFLSKHYDVTPFRLYAQNNPYAAFLLNSLDSYPSKEPFKEYQKLSDSLQVTLSDHQVRTLHNARYFSQQKLVAFNSFVSQNFMQMATREMLVRVETGQMITQAARHILARYELSEDDLSLDALIRYYNAYHQTINGKVKAKGSYAASRQKAGLPS